MSQTTATHRPASVTLLVVLVFLNGILQVISGIVFLAVASNNSVQRSMDAEAGTIRVLAVFSILVGLIVLAVARGLAHGSNGARILVTLLQVISLVGGVYMIIAYGSAQIAGVIGSVIVSLLILWLLWNRRANEFFR